MFILYKLYYTDPLIFTARLLLKLYNENNAKTICILEQEKLSALSELLWRFKSISFLAHGYEGGKTTQAENRIWLTTEHDITHTAQVVLVENTFLATPQNHEKVFCICDAHKEDLLEDIMLYVQKVKNTGKAITIFQEKEKGWDKQLL